VHVFSHFRLRIMPLICVVERAAVVSEPAASWVPVEDLAAAALPAPIRRLLESTAQRSGSKPLPSSRR